MMYSLLSLVLLGSNVAHAKDPCVKNKELTQWIHEVWVDLSNTHVSAATKATLARGGAKTWNYPDGWGWVRTDVFAVEVTLPEGLSPRTILDMVRDDPTRIGRGRFARQVGWVASRLGRKRLAVVDLDIWGPDNGAIAYLDVDTSDGDFQVITVENAASGTHPVSGMRRWGYVELDNGRTLFYTAGIESANVAGTGDVGSALQFGTWSDLVRDIGKEVQMRGGTEHMVYADDEWQPGGLKPGTNTTATVDHPGAIDVKRSPAIWDAIERAAAQSAGNHLPH
jgi:hypothetical protein